MISVFWLYLEQIRSSILCSYTIVYAVSYLRAIDFNTLPPQITLTTNLHIPFLLIVGDIYFKSVPGSRIDESNSICICNFGIHYKILHYSCAILHPTSNELKFLLAECVVKLFDFSSVIGKENISVVLICIYFTCDNEKLSCIYLHVSCFCELSACWEDFRCKCDWSINIMLGVTAISRHSASCWHQMSLLFQITWFSLCS